MRPSIQSVPVLRTCRAIGLKAIEPPAGCPHASPFCRQACYNNKFLVRNGKNIRPRQRKDSVAWQSARASMFHRLERVRVATRNEPFKTMTDVRRVARWLQGAPDCMFHIPTRAWRSPVLYGPVMDFQLIPNARVLASTDPSTTTKEWHRLLTDGWSTMFFGDDRVHPLEARAGPGAASPVRCPKTWNHVEKACRSCNVGCFNESQVHVWLKRH
jgi:hypothetical protein